MKSLLLSFLVLGTLSSFAQYYEGTTVYSDLNVECFNEDNFLSKSLTLNLIVVTPKGIITFDKDNNRGETIDFSALKGLQGRSL